MKNHTPVARRYAEALADALSDRNEGEQAKVRDQLAAFADLVENNPDVRNVMLNPSVASGDRKAVLQDLLEHLKADDIARRFLQLLGDRGRMSEVRDVVGAFERLQDERAGVVRAQVASAEPLDKGTLGQIQEALERRLQHKVEITTEIRPELIAGVRTRVGSMVFDGSLKAQLKRLREQLESAGA